MTCIAGLVAPDGSVIIMGDSAASTPSTVYVMRDSKVWASGELVLGISGSYRGRDLLAFRQLPQPTVGANIDLWMRAVFVNDVKEAFKSGGHMTSYNSGDDSTKTRILVGVRGRLFWLDGDYHIGEVATDYLAIGSGSAEANGSLYSTRDWPDPVARLTEAMKASSYYNAGQVRPPYLFVQTAARVKQVAA